MTEPDSAHAGSRVLWKLVNVAVRVFYRVERVGPPLPDGALLLVATHPNTLLAPSLVQTPAGRPQNYFGSKKHPATIGKRLPGAWPELGRTHLEPPGSLVSMKSINRTGRY